MPASKTHCYPNSVMQLLRMAAQGDTTRKIIHALTLVSELGLSGPVMAGQFEDGGAAADTGDYATALQFWRPLADQGNASAQYNLGFACDDA